MYSLIMALTCSLRSIFAAVAVCGRRRGAEVR
jgi:hypothetical protein